MARQSYFCLSFGGTDAYIDLTNLDHNTLSVGLWLQRQQTGLSNGHDALFCSNNNNGWGIGFQSDGTADKDKVFFSKIGVDGFLSTSSITDTTTWHHVVFTYDGATGKVYIDGVLDRSVAYAQTFSSGGGHYTIAGRSNTQLFRGLIDDVFLTTNVVSATTIAEIYAGTFNVKNLSSLAGLWRLEEGAGTSISDSSGNAVTGTLNGSNYTWTSNNIPAPLQLSFDPTPPVTIGPPIPGSPWFTHQPIPPVTIFAPGAGPPPPPPLGGNLAYPLGVKMGPPMPGAPWFSVGGATAPPQPGGPSAVPPAPPAKPPMLPFIPRFNPGDTMNRDTRLQKHTEQVSNILNSLLSNGQLVQTGPTSFTLSGGAGGVISFNTRIGAVTLQAGDVIQALFGATQHQVFAGNASGYPSFRALAAADLPFSGVTAGGYTNANITVDQFGRVIAAANGSSSAGTVTTVSVVTANGFAGSVANATTTPAITISTSVTGVLKGNGTAISAASDGTDYWSPTSLPLPLTVPNGGTATTLGVTGAIAYYSNSLTLGPLSSLTYLSGTLTLVGSFYSTGSSTSAFIIENSGTFANLLAINTSQGCIGIGTAAVSTSILKVQGYQPASVASTPGTVGESIILTGSTGGTTTSSGASATGGAGGAITVTGGAGGTSASATVQNNGGTGGAYSFTTGAGGSISGGPSNANAVGGNSGSSTISTGTGGAGTATGSGAATGGTSGSVTSSTGTGGAATSASGGTSHGANSGGVTFTTGAGGASTGGTTALAGNSGAYSFSTGTGGTASGASTSNTSGNSGALAFSTGNGRLVTSGTATTNNGGSAGNISFVTGAGGTASGGGTNNGGNGGNITFRASVGGNGDVVGTNGGIAFGLNSGVGPTVTAGAFTIASSGTVYLQLDDSGSLTLSNGGINVSNANGTNPLTFIFNDGNSAIRQPDQTSGNITSNPWSIQGGAGSGSGAGSNVTVAAGAGGSTGGGGQLTLQAGNGTGNGGGAVLLAAGSDTTASQFGGDVFIQAGEGNASNKDGHIKLTDPRSGFHGILITNALSADRNFTFPNAAGTLALTGNITNITVAAIAPISNVGTSTAVTLSLTASAGSGISLSTGTGLTITNTGVLTVAVSAPVTNTGTSTAPTLSLSSSAGAGISLSTGAGLTITNTGVLTVAVAAPITNAGTSTAPTLGLSSTYTIAANTANAYILTDGTTNLFVIDTRNTVTGVNAVTVTGAPPTITSASGDTWNQFAIAVNTVTFTGTTGVTAMDGLGIYINGTTLTAAGSVTVTTASSLFVGIPVAAGSVGITNLFAAHFAGKIRVDDNIDLTNAPAPATVIFATNGQIALRDQAASMQLLLTGGNSLTEKGVFVFLAGNLTFASAATNIQSATIYVNPRTCTLSGTTATTSWLGTQCYLDNPTITDSSACTLTTASVLHIATLAPAGGSLVITNKLMISTGTTGCFLTNAGTWTNAVSSLSVKKMVRNATDLDIESILARITPRSWKYREDKIGDDHNRDRVGIVIEELPEELHVPGPYPNEGFCDAVAGSFLLATVKMLWDEVKALRAELDRRS